MALPRSLQFASASVPDRQWFLVFQDGRELPISGTVLDYAPTEESDSWAESDGSAGLRGFVVKSDKYAEAKAILAAMISAGRGAFPETTNAYLAARRRDANSTMAGSTAPSPRGCKPEGNSTRSAFWSGSTRIPSTSAFPRAPHSTSTSRRRSIWARPRSAFPLPFRRQTTRLSTMKFCHAIILLCLFAGCATRKEVRSMRPLEVPGTTVAAGTCRKSARRKR